MNTSSARLGRLALGAAAAAAAVTLARRWRTDPARAPGHRHRGPAPTVSAPNSADRPSDRDQPWVRRSPVVDRVLPMAEIEQAHAHMRESGHFGKIVLEVRRADG